MISIPLPQPILCKTTPFNTFHKEVGHCVIIAKCTFKLIKPKAYVRTMWKFKNANFAQYRVELYDYKWAKCFEGNDIHTISDNINKKYLKCSQICNSEQTGYHPSL